MATHKQLQLVLRDQEEYMSGKYSGERPDCSCSCKFFHKLTGDVGMDFGVCYNPLSPRAGLLTFEHMSCDQYEYDKQVEKDDCEVCWGAQFLCGKDGLACWDGSGGCKRKDRKPCHNCKP